MRKNYYVVNAGRGRATHIMYSLTPSTPNPRSVAGVTAQLLWFGGNAKPTLCGLAATRHVSVFTPAEVSCRECRRRWELAQGTSRAATSRTTAATQALAELRQSLAEVSRGLDQAIADGSLPLITRYRTAVEALAAQNRDGEGFRRHPEVMGEFDEIIARARAAETAILVPLQREVDQFAREVAEFEREVSRRRATGQSGETITGAQIQATMAALLRDPGRPDSEIARETGVPEATVATLRHELTQGETAGMIAREGLTAADFETLASPAQAQVITGKDPDRVTQITAVIAAVLRDPGRPDSEIAGETGVPEASVRAVRDEVTQGETADVIASGGLTAADFGPPAAAGPAGKAPAITGGQALAALKTHLAGGQPSVPGLTDAQATELARVMAESAHLPADEFRAALATQGVAIADS
jgi:hypothetical protein